ncbi:MAG: pseudouridine synthase [Persephonella sp.]|nr:MAG: pseudouridine synthase [Persephonella sp.]RUM62086.1 MAG: pseudouridine synthase [Persephonella sp.]
MELIRLNKYLASTGCCSRRKADLLIQEGKVKVNGEIVRELGIKINPKNDKVEVDGKLVKPVKKFKYVKLYKPRGVLTQLGKDKFGRKTLTDLFKEIGIKDNLFPIGRLDLDSEGLLLLTNDGDFANFVMHPKNKIPKRYIVEVKGRVNIESFNKMRKGTFLEYGEFLKPDDIKIVKKKRNSTVLDITIHSGQKRVIRRFTKAFGYPVLRLKRIQIGNIKLEDLKAGEWKYITERELNIFKRKYLLTKNS